MCLSWDSIQTWLGPAGTVFIAVLVFWIQQWLSERFFRPVREIRKTIARIAADLDFYGSVHPAQNATGSQLGRISEASDCFRRHGADLRAGAFDPILSSVTIPLGLRMGRGRLLAVAGDLIGLSNWLHANPNSSEDVYQRIKDKRSNIRLQLRIKN